jgi:NB-ARC domain
VFLGPTGLGPWQEVEIRVAINHRVRERQRPSRFRVVPVFLPGAQRDSLPALLVDTTWVEFRGSIDDTDAFRRLVCGIRGIAPGPGEPDARGSPRTLHNLPFAPNLAFTGREADLERLGEHLQKRGGVALTQTVALHGLGGVGKTQLVVEYAWKHLGGYAAVLWVRADSPEALDANLAGLAGLLGLPEASAKEQNVQTDAVLRWLKGNEQWLLLADNADTDEAAKAVHNRFPPHLGGHVLVTSRLGDWPVNMARFSLDLLSASDAARYLRDRVAKEGYHADDDAAARKLAEDLGYLPLALEQAASFILKLRWSFDKYRECLHEARPKLLSYQAEGGTRYSASVAKTWSITLERLGSLARALLRLAAWFAPDGIPRGIFLANPTVFSESLGDILVSRAMR